jgi:hypothetical protein
MAEGPKSIQPEEGEGFACKVMKYGTGVMTTCESNMVICDGNYSTLLKKDA